MCHKFQESPDVSVTEDLPPLPLALSRGRLPLMREASPMEKPGGKPRGKSQGKTIDPDLWPGLLRDLHLCWKRLIYARISRRGPDFPQEARSVPVISAGEISVRPGSHTRSWARQQRKKIRPRGTTCGLAFPGEHRKPEVEGLLAEVEGTCRNCIQFASGG